MKTLHSVEILGTEMVNYFDTQEEALEFIENYESECYYLEFEVDDEGSVI